jgi:hypothetical protein
VTLMDLDEVAEATAAVTDAQKLIAQLEARVADGDTGVTAEDLEQARGLLRMAELRKQGAERRAVDRQAENDQQARAELLADIQAFADPDELRDLQDLYGQALDAVEALRGALDDRDERWQGLLRRGLTLAVPRFSDHPLPTVPGVKRLQPSRMIEMLASEIRNGVREVHALHSPDRAAHITRAADEQQRAREQVRADKLAVTAARQAARKAPALHTEPDPSTTAGFRGLSRVFGDRRPS